MNTIENQRWIEKQHDPFTEILYIFCQLKGMKYDNIFSLLSSFTFLARV